MRSDAVLETFGLTKEYAGRAAVRELSLRVMRGEIYGFLGLNGAGKTTTIRMILGLVHPTNGSVEVLGHHQGLRSEAARSRVGALTDAGFYGNLTVHENLDIARRLMCIRSQARIAATLTLVGMEGEAARLARTLSTGMRQRLRLARALIHEPELLVLDEPTNGLDPAGIREVRLLLRSLAEEKGVTVFMSSHILAEVQQVATRIGILHRGQLVEEIGREQLQLRSRSYLDVEVSDPPMAAWVLEDQMGIRDFTVTERRQLRIYQDLDRAAEINGRLVGAGVAVGQVVLRHESLEDHFMNLTGGGPNGKGTAR